MAELALPEAEAQAPPGVTVLVNERPVEFSKRRATGREIKETAVAQAVPIQPDFILFEVQGAAQLRQVRDDEVVQLHPHQQFRAVAPDDNS